MLLFLALLFPAAYVDASPSVLVLLGYMGAGKSLVGATVAATLGWRFVDLDALIVARTGLRIPLLFETLGEDAFRQHEHAALVDVLDGPRPCVVALGGGAWGADSNRAILRAEGAWCVWLDVAADVAWRRVAGDDQRPLVLQGRQAFDERWANRRHAYALADGRVDASASLEDVCAAVVSQFQQQGGVDRGR